MANILITGTSKGLGLELALHYLALGNLVIGVSRSRPPIEDARYHHCSADVCEESCLNDLSQCLAALAISRIDLLINNAGHGGSGYYLSEVEPGEILNQVNLHCVGALRVTKAARGYLKNAKVVNVTSRLGSMLQNARGDFAQRRFSYAYRIGKCAQNMLSLCMANDPELAGVTVMSVNPGLLKTDSGATDASHTAAEGAAAFAEVVAGTSHSGVYHAFGEEAAY